MKPASPKPAGGEVGCVGVVIGVPPHIFWRSRRRKRGGDAPPVGNVPKSDAGARKVGDHRHDDVRRGHFPPHPRPGTCVCGDGVAAALKIPHNVAADATGGAKNHHPDGGGRRLGRVDARARTIVGGPTRWRQPAAAAPAAAAGLATCELFAAPCAAIAFLRGGVLTVIVAKAPLTRAGRREAGLSGAGLWGMDSRRC